MNNMPLYNSVIIKTYLEYLEKNYPKINIHDILKYSNISAYEVEDRGHWLTQEQVNRFQEYASEATNNPIVAREAGRYIASPTSSNILRRITMGFISPQLAYWAAGKLATTISRHLTIKTNKISNNKIEIISTPKAFVKEELYQCDNRVGMFEAIAEVFTHKFGKVDHPKCIHRGDNCCHYIVTWERPLSMLLERIGFILLAFSVFLSTILFFLISFNNWLLIFLSSIFIPIIFLLSSNILRNIDMSFHLKNIGKAAEEVIEQINIRYNETLLIKDIGEATSRILDPFKLLDFTSSALQKHLKFSRGMIMLANQDKTKLIYVSGYGYNFDQEQILKNTEFNLTKQESKGVFHLAFHDQKPFIVDSAQSIKSSLSERSVDYINALDVKSFICVPIIYEGKSEGVLAVDNSQSEYPATQSDLSLLIGIAQQLGISLNNARTHKKVKESEERFRSLSNNAPDIIYQVNLRGIVTYVNPAWKELLGHDLLDVINRNITDFVRQEDRDKLFQTLQDIIKKNITLRDINFIFINNKDLPRHVTLTGAPDIDSDGNVIGIIGTLKDISHMRSMEAQLLQASKMEALGSLTGGVAHDFNNIIQAIMGYNQIMMTGRKDSATQKKYHQNIQELISRSRELIQQLLLYGRKSDTQLKSININNDVLNTINLLSKSIPKAINIESRLSDELLPIVADSNLIGQIIMNLVINARDAMGESGTINIYTNNLTANNSDYLSTISVPPGNYIRLIVTDTGCGMDKDILEHIFEPFFTTKEVGKGTGLGLSVVKQIVQSLNGYISCDSIPNRGTTFEILLPAADRDIEAASQTEQSVELKHGKEKLLIVDDESYVLETVKDTLSSYGYKILTADSIDEALKTYSAKKDKIKLVLLDLNMPGSGGKKCLLDILAINKSAKILMTSGYTTKVQIDDLINTGASGFIIKPYRTEELLVSIRNILDSCVN